MAFKRFINRLLRRKFREPKENNSRYIPPWAVTRIFWRGSAVEVGR